MPALGGDSMIYCIHTRRPLKTLPTSIPGPSGSANDFYSLLPWNFLLLEDQEDITHMELVKEDDGFHFVTFNDVRKDHFACGAPAVDHGGGIRILTLGHGMTRLTTSGHW
jgi:hypothetical protein